MPCLKILIKKIAELDAEEAKQKELDAKKATDENKDNIKPDLPTDFKSIPDIKPLDLETDIEKEAPEIAVPNENKNDILSSVNTDIGLGKNDFSKVENEVSEVHSKLGSEPVVSKNNHDDNLNFKIPDLDTLLANLVGDEDSKENIVEHKEKIKEAKVEPVSEKISPTIEEPITAPAEANNINNTPELSKQPENDIINEVASDELQDHNNNDIILDIPKPTVSGSLRDMLYNPVNANLGESTNDSNNKFISTPSISEITENAKNTPIENKTMENEVIKSAEKPIINVKPEEIKNETNQTISDDEFFDDFFGD